MSGHTPGPWRVRCRVDRGYDLKGTDKYFYIAAGFERWHDNKGHFHPDDARYVLDEHHVVALGSDRDHDSPEGGIQNEADANLIAASPDLLKAAHAAFHALKSYEHGNASPDLARTCAAAIEGAILKAEGR